MPLIITPSPPTLFSHHGEVIRDYRGVGLQGAEPEDGQEGVDGNTHRGGEPAVFGVCPPWLLPGSPTHFPPPDQPQCLGAKETFGII